VTFADSVSKQLERLRAGQLDTSALGCKRFDAIRFVYGGPSIFGETVVTLSIPGSATWAG
jgi:hypothetical protein